VSTGIGGNSQSSTGYTFVTDYATNAAGKPLLDANGSPIPVFTPGLSEVWNFPAVRGAQIDIKTTSLYAQDRWSVNRHLTLDLGTRFEAVRSKATGDITAVNTSTIVPRLAAIYDIKGNGKTTVQASYAHYAGKYGQVQFSSNTNVGRPNEVDYEYTGPAGQGASFAPGLDPANYTNVVFANFPTANVKVAPGLQSPLTKEFTLALGRELGSRVTRRRPTSFATPRTLSRTSRVSRTASSTCRTWERSRTSYSTTRTCRSARTKRRSSRATTAWATA